MTRVYPLVMDKTTGLPREMRPDEELAVKAKEVDFRSLTNGEASDVILKCSPVYISGSNTVSRASAAAIGTSKVRGLAMGQIPTSQNGEIQASGTLTATATEWDRALGVDTQDVNYTPVGLVPNTDYYLSLGFGLITATPPSATNQSIVFLGTADGSTDLELDIDRPIVLS